MEPRTTTFVEVARIEPMGVRARAACSGGAFMAVDECGRGSEKGRVNAGHVADGDVFRDKVRTDWECQCSWLRDGIADGRRR